MDYGYGLGIVPPQDPVYLREFERRTREWYEETIKDSESLLQRRLQDISFSYHIALTLPQTIGRIEIASSQDGKYATLSRRYRKIMSFWFSLTRWHTWKMVQLSEIKPCMFLLIFVVCLMLFDCC